MSQTRSLAWGGLPKINEEGAISAWAGVTDGDFQGKSGLTIATRSRAGTAGGLGEIDWSFAGETTVGQIFPIGHGQEGPQHDRSGCVETGRHDVAVVGPAISESASKTWHS